MATELRNTGISVVGDIPWGAHFCCFYDTREDLLDILIPYFKTGLENNEFCLWVISNSELLTAQEAMSALRSAVPDLDRYLADRSLEIVGHDEWFVPDGSFDFHQVANRFKEKVHEALARGHVGIRVNGSPAWLQPGNAKELRQFEEEVDQLFSELPILASCTYPLPTMGGDQVFDTVRTHQFAIARRQGAWEIIETPELRQARTEIARLNQELQRFKEHQSAQPLILRYGVAVLSVAAALIVTLGMRTQLGQGSTPIVAMFLCTIMFSAWFGGFKPGLLAIALSLLTFKYFFATPFYSFAIDVREIPRVLIFTLSAFFIASLSAAQRTTAESLRRARDILEETVQELRRSNQALRKENAERRHAEALLYTKEQEFRAIVENAPDQIIRYDRNFRRVYVNPAVARAYGLPEQALIGKPVGSVIRDAGFEINANQVEQVRERITSVFNTGETIEFELIWPLLNGQRHLNVRLFPELDVNGSVIYVLGVTRDITERTRAEAELKNEKEVLEKIFDNIPLMIGFVGVDGGIKLVNAEWERRIGWTLRELQEQKVDIFAEAYPDPQYRQQVLDFVAASTGEWVDLKIRVRDGRVIDAACAVVHLSDGTRVAIAQDITERKQTEKRLKTTSEQLRAFSARLQSVKEEEDIRIAREIHDEMGSGLASLRWELERFDQSISEAEDWSERDALKARIQDMIRLTDTTIRTMRRIAAELRPSILDDLGLVEAIEWQTEQFQNRTGIVSRCDCSMENFDFDPEQSTAIFRIFQEALTNVLRHARATTVEVLMREEDGEFVLSISDNGSGINENEKSGTRSLGILGMRERAHLIGAEFEINGVEGKGTSVTLRVPVAGKKKG